MPRGWLRRIERGAYCRAGDPMPRAIKLAKEDLLAVNGWDVDKMGGQDNDWV